MALVDIKIKVRAFGSNENNYCFRKKIIESYADIERMLRNRFGVMLKVLKVHHIDNQNDKMVICNEADYAMMAIFGKPTELYVVVDDPSGVIRC